MERPSTDVLQGTDHLTSRAMSSMNWFARRFRALFRRREVEMEMSDELRFHFDAMVAEGRRRGLSAYDERPTDIPTYVTAVLGIVGAALLGSWVPARRASRVPPVVALRAE